VSEFPDQVKGIRVTIENVADELGVYGGAFITIGNEEMGSRLIAISRILEEASAELHNAVGQKMMSELNEAGQASANILIPAAVAQEDQA
jgi:hypothetical protein